jgi:DNA-binding HxlR family transcriptional regulator
LHDCLSLLAGAWTADVVWFLRDGERCFTELEHDLKGVSAKMPASRLRMLEQRGVADETDFSADRLVRAHRWRDTNWQRP